LVHEPLKNRDTPLGVVTHTPPFGSSEIAVIRSAGSPSMVVSTAGVGGSVVVVQRMSPREVPTHTSPEAAATQFTGRESEKLRTRTGALAALTPTPLTSVLADGPQPSRVARATLTGSAQAASASAVRAEKDNRGFKATF
jgi:hypothetical protein